MLFPGLRSPESHREGVGVPVSAAPSLPPAVHLRAPDTPTPVAVVAPPAGKFKLCAMWTDAHS